ncbi:formimidoylglutamate deiminase [Vulgatibacter incomptus]|uniref:Formiminoglutamic iminohydrolase n=1 Tax=Vulgatibacter incomptus TaxID=1391653 RepID=A0A0K1PH86_9BACT|nr:formimidoylglutamate deiminase [Vulgatibacter incomptus]AKU92872.1 Formiminoglutamic iminohydrolase [Vulgatibacter incomptus]
MEILLPDFVYVDGSLRGGLAVHIGDDGTIAKVAPPAPGATLTRLAGRALLPGFVNGHSHAFQRAIRGRSEYRQKGRATDDFWTWREQMYAAAMRVDPDQLEAISRMAFVEMALAGITSVGEFHYLHHPAEGGRYDDPDELAVRVAKAASDAGVELVLLRVGYARAGFGREPNPRQIRFIDRSADETLGAVQRLRGRGMRTGVAPHSVRALPLEWLRALADYAQAHRLPLHMHLSEQPREIDESVAEHGLRPGALALREGWVDERFTGVHGVHLEQGEIDGLGSRGATICACPTTERNLGDGIVRAKELLAAGARICFGTDSQIEIAPLQDARALEYHLRLQKLERAILGSDEGDDRPDRLAARLLDCATRSGARALGLPSGRIEEGLSADLVAVDLDDPSICGAAGPALLPTMVFSAERTAVREVWARGVKIVSEGRHIQQERAVRDFARVMAELWS